MVNLMTPMTSIMVMHGPHTMWLMGWMEPRARTDETRKLSCFGEFYYILAVIIIASTAQLCVLTSPQPAAAAPPQPPGRPRPQAAGGPLLPSHIPPYRSQPAPPILPDRPWPITFPAIYPGALPRPRC